MKKTVLSAILAAALLLSACGTAATDSTTSATDSAQAGENAAGPVLLTAEEAHARMESGDPIVVLDVRTAEEYAEKHIPGAVLLPNEEIGTARPAVLPVLDTEILIYCRSGNRSAQAAQKLFDMGYTNVYDFGGINSWTYDTESGEYAAPAKDGTLSSFTAYDLSGVAVDESIFADYKLTMINIWGTFCSPCLREMPELGKLSEEYADKGVQIVGIVADVLQQSDGSFSQDGVQTARDLVAQTGAGYLHLLGSYDLVKAKLGSVSGVPDTIFVDSRGNLVGLEYLGANSAEQWTKIIDETLAGVGA